MEKGVHDRDVVDDVARDHQVERRMSLALGGCGGILGGARRSFAALCRAAACAWCGGGGDAGEGVGERRARGFACIRLYSKSKRKQ